MLSVHFLDWDEIEAAAESVMQDSGVTFDPNTGESAQHRINE
jgi:hypothetical protein